MAELKGALAQARQEATEREASLESSLEKASTQKATRGMELANQMLQAQLNKQSLQVRHRDLIDACMHGCMFCVRESACPLSRAHTEPLTPLAAEAGVGAADKSAGWRSRRSRGRVADH